jgi:DNA-binding transcriptional LysR family regulator
MNIGDLQLLLAVLEHGNIAAGARQRGISPSLASRRIGALEQQVGARLLLRTTRRLAPTAAGARLAEWARGMLAEWERTSEEIVAQDGRVSGLVRLATNDLAAVDYLPALLADFARRHAQVQVNVSIALEPIRLLDGACDLALHAGRRPDAALIGRKLYEYRRCVVAAPDYLAQHGTPRQPADLAAHRCLTHTISEPAEWCFEAAGGSILTQPIRSHMACDSWTVLRGLALAGAGIARLARRMVQADLEAGRLVQLLPDLRSVYADGEPPAMWVLFADRQVPLRVRMLADHLMAGLLALHRAGG